MSIGLYKGKSLTTGKELIGYAVECNGAINQGRVYICPAVMAACYSGIGHGETHMSIGPFIEVDPATVEPVPEEPRAANTKFSFLYRDAGNYKTYNEYVLAGGLTAEEIQEIFECGEMGSFISAQVGLSHDFPGRICEDDHAWCEFFEEDSHGFEPTDFKPTSELTAQQLLENFRAAKGHWDELRYAPWNL